MDSIRGFAPKVAYTEESWFELALQALHIKSSFRGTFCASEITAQKVGMQASIRAKI